MIIQKADSNFTELALSLHRCRNIQKRKRHFQTCWDFLQAGKLSFI